MSDIQDILRMVCAEFEQWFADLPAWVSGPWVGQSRGYRGPTLLGEADCRLHLVRFLAQHLGPEWLHQEVATSTYLFPTADVPRSFRIDIGIIDPKRLHPALTAEQMHAVRWNALLEVKFRGASPGWDFAIAGAQNIRSDVQKLTKLRAFADHVGVIVVEELPPLTLPEIAEIQSQNSEVALYFASLPSPA